MKVSILIRSYAKDACWLEYCLESIAKFCTGFHEIVVLVAEYDRFVFQATDGKVLNGQKVRLATYPGNRQKPMLECMCRLCYADEYCHGADFVLHTDSDCIFVKPVTPDTFFANGKPDLLVRSFDSLRGQGAYCWRASTENCLRMPVTHETMCRHPAVHYRELYPSFRHQVELMHGIQFHDYCTRGPNVFPWYWAEFPALGYWAMRSMPTKYNWIDVSGMSEQDIERNHKTHLKQGWSHYDMNDTFQRSQANEQRRQFEEILK